MNEELLLQALLGGVEGDEEEALMQMLASMFGGQDEDDNERVVLSTKPEAQASRLNTVIEATVEMLAEMRSDIEELEEGYKAEYTPEENGKITLSDVDEAILVSRVGAYELVKEVTNQFIVALLHDDVDVVEVIEDEDYDGCNCAVCSVQAQVTGK